jgi:hypothetical protein
VTAAARLAGGQTQVRVRFSDHAVQRFRERVRPGLGSESAAEQISLITEHGEVTVGPPSWADRATSFLYLVVGDVCFPLDADKRDREVLVATTCIVRGKPRKKRRACAVRKRRRNARLMQAHAVNRQAA